MPYATNSVDGTRVYFEDEGGNGAPVVFYGGFLDPIDEVRESRIAMALPARFRPIYVDQRGLGHSDKPHDPESYSIRLRVADAMAVLDELGIDRAHFIGTSWGGRLCFGLGEHAPDRVRTLVIGGATVRLARQSDHPRRLGRAGLGTNGRHGGPRPFA